MPLKLRSLSLNLPFGLGGVDIDVTETEAIAAWELYVEMATRVAGYDAGAGSPREALDSLYSLFATTRDVLRRAGPEVGSGSKSVGAIAIRVLNEGLRPFLVRWHVVLRTTTDELDDEQTNEFQAGLAELRAQLAEYVDVLARIAGIN